MSSGFTHMPFPVLRGRSEAATKGGKKKEFSAGRRTVIVNSHLQPLAFRLMRSAPPMKLWCRASEREDFGLLTLYS
jgi:hypothetical protein